MCKLFKNKYLVFSVPPQHFFEQNCKLLSCICQTLGLSAAEFLWLNLLLAKREGKLLSSIIYTYKKKSVAFTPFAGF